MANSEGPSALRDTFHSVRHVLFIPVLMSLVYGLLRLAGPLFMILIFDRVLPSRSEATLVSLLLLLVITLAVMTLVDYSRRRLLARFGAQFQERIEDQILGSAARGAYHTKGGTKPATGLNEADQLRGFFHSGSLVNVLDFLWSPVFLAIVFVIHPVIGWVVVVGLALLVLINIIKSSSERARKERHKEASSGIGELKDTLLASRHVIESQGMMAAYNKRWMLARRRSRDSALELKDLTAWFTILSSHTALLIQYTTLAVAAYLTIEGELTVGTMVASMYLARLVFFPAERFLKQVPAMREAIQNWKSLDNTLGVAKTPTAVLDNAATTFCLSQLRVRCPVSRDLLLRNLNVEVSPGSSIEIVGGSGSGKTVLAETMIGRFARAGGKVLLGVVDVERLSITDTPQILGYIPQRVDFVSGTLAENIAGLHMAPEMERLVHVAQLAEVHHKILSLPDSYLTRIDTNGSIFSKTERHRLALARALYWDPKVLIIDDPDVSLTDALSNSLKQEIADFLSRGGILIMMSCATLKSYNPTRRFTLEDGRLKEIKFDKVFDKKVVRLAE